MSLQTMREPGPVSAVQSGGTITATRRTVNQGAQIRVNEPSFRVSTMGYFSALRTLPELLKQIRNHYGSFAYSAFAFLRTGMSRSASFRSVKKYYLAKRGASLTCHMNGQGFNSTVSGPLQCVLEATTQGHRIPLKSIVYLWKAVCNNQLSGLRPHNMRRSTGGMNNEWH